MNRRTTLLTAMLVILVAALLTLPACGGSSTGSTDSSTVFKIGFPADLSGIYASYDQPTADGLKLAVDEINAAGGVNGTKLELTVKDNKGDKALCIQLTQELIDNGMQYMVGTTTDGLVPSAALAGTKEIPSDGGDNTAPNLVTDAGPWAFQYILADNVEAAAIAEWSYNDQGYKTAVTMRSPDISYSANHPRYFQSAFERLGGKVLQELSFKIGGGDFSAQVTKIKAMQPQPDMIYTPMFMPDTPVFMKQLRSAGVQTPVVSTDGNDTPDILQAGAGTLEGLTFGTFGYPTPGSDLEKFNAKYEAATGKAPDTVLYSVGYDIGLILKAALDKTGGKGGQTLRDTILHLSGVKLTTTDNFVMDPATRRAKRGTTMVEIVNGKFTFVKNLPYPSWVPPVL